MAVIGGGPAGMSAALWCSELGLRVALIEREAELGGQLLWTFGTIENYLGVRAVNGAQLSSAFADQLAGRGITRLQGVEVTAADLAARSVTFADGRAMFCRALILATGVRRRVLGVPGEEELVGKGILQSGQKAREDVARKRVIIVGGGDAALENALILSETADKVTVVHRRDKLSARDEFVSKAGERANVEFLFNATIEAIIGDDRVHAVDVIGPDNNRTRIECDRVLIRIGVEPNVGLIKGALDLDDRGYIPANADCSTSVDGVYAVGDVACPLSPTIATAVGMGATAAKAIIARIARDRASA